MNGTLKLIVWLAILSQSVYLINCDEDEFAEFDDNIRNDVPSQINKIVEKNDNKNGQQQPKVQQADLNSHVKSSDEVKTSDKTPSSNSESANGSEEETTQKKPDLKLVNSPQFRQFKLEDYAIELGFILATILYLINYFIGRAKNLEIAHEWYSKSKELLKQQFVLVGGVPTIDNCRKKRDEEAEANLAALRKQKGLIKSSESVFTLWCSGRVGMDGLLVEINLLKRQDLLTMAVNLLRATKDNLTLRFALGQEGYENFVFCIAHRTQAASLARDMVDINTFAPKRKPLSQCGYDLEKLVVMSELSDPTTFILDQKTVSFLKKYEKSVNYIHITDHFSSDRSEEVSALQKLANPKRLATFSFSLPQTAEERIEVISFALSLLDRLRRFKLARDSKQKSDKNRQKITDYLQKTEFSLRQEAAQAKKEELRRLEKERIYNEDDPEKQRRWEKKEAKREQKKNKMRVKQLKVSL